jgi:hypothetical protein
VAPSIHGDSNGFNTTALSFTTRRQLSATYSRYDFGIWFALLLVVERRHIGGCYGKGYRVLYSGVVSQASEVDPTDRAGQGT